MLRMSDAEKIALLSEKLAVYDKLLNWAKLVICLLVIGTAAVVAFASKVENMDKQGTQGTLAWRQKHEAQDRRVWQLMVGVATKLDVPIPPLERE